MNLTTLFSKKSELIQKNRILTSQASFIETVMHADPERVEYDENGNALKTKEKKSGRKKSDLKKAKSATLNQSAMVTSLPATNGALFKSETNSTRDCSTNPAAHKIGEQIFGAFLFGLDRVLHSEYLIMNSLDEIAGRLWLSLGSQSKQLLKTFLAPLELPADEVKAVKDYFEEQERKATEAEAASKAAEEAGEPAPEVVAETEEELAERTDFEERREALEVLKKEISEKRIKLFGFDWLAEDKERCYSLKDFLQEVLTKPSSEAHLMHAGLFLQFQMAEHPEETAADLEEEPAEPAAEGEAVEAANVEKEEGEEAAPAEEGTDTAAKEVEGDKENTPAASGTPRNFSFRKVEPASLNRLLLCLGQTNLQKDQHIIVHTHSNLGAQATSKEAVTAETQVQHAVMSMDMGNADEFPKTLLSFMLAMDKKHSLFPYMFEILRRFTLSNIGADEATEMSVENLGFLSSVYEGLCAALVDWFVESGTPMASLGVSGWKGRIVTIRGFDAVFERSIDRMSEPWEWDFAGNSMEFFWHVSIPLAVAAGVARPVFSKQKALLMLHFAHQACSEQPQIQRFGYTLRHSFAGKDCLCLVASDTSHLVLSFRLSLPLNTYVNCTDLATTKFIGGNTHSMAAHAYASIRPQIMQQVHAFRLRMPQMKVWCTGYQLGGSLAALCAVDIESTLGIRAVSIYTFGSARVGDAAFSQNFSARISDAFHLRSTLDPVPNQPHILAQLGNAVTIDPVAGKLTVQIGYPGSVPDTPRTTVRDLAVKTKFYREALSGSLEPVPKSQTIRKSRKSSPSPIKQRVHA
jgi:hypothetical protein